MKVLVMPSSVATIAQDISIVLGTVIALCIIIERMVKVYQVTAMKIHSRNMNARLRSIMIMPSLEEIAKYSIKEPQRFELGEGLHRIKEDEIRMTSQKLFERAKSDTRIMLLALYFIFGFLTLAIRYIVL